MDPNGSQQPREFSEFSLMAPELVAGATCLRPTRGTRSKVISPFTSSYQVS